MKTSIFWKISSNELQSILDSSASISDVMRKFGYSPSNGSCKTLSLRIKKDNLSLCKMKLNWEELKKIKTKNTKEELFSETSNCGRRELKNFVMKNNLLAYKCEKCNNEGFWQGEKISLQLEHKNGINNDNRLENICFLCPNCHSQTPTYAGRNRHVEKKCKIILCKNCGKATKGYSNVCIKCSNEMKPKKFEVSKEELEKMINEKSFLEIGRIFGVSDNAVRKRCVKLGITLSKNRLGFWSKRNKEIRSCLA